MRRLRIFFVTPLVLPTSTSSGSDPHNHAAEVHQVSFWTKGDTPTPGSFTAYFTLKNQGGAKAVGVQIFVRPYRGISLRNTDRRMNSVSPDRLSDDDPLSQFGQWVGFPDLAPGESSTQSFVFLNRGNVSPGDNPNPQIDFETEKGKP